MWRVLRDQRKTMRRRARPDGRELLDRRPAAASGRSPAASPAASSSAWSTTSSPSSGCCADHLRRTQPTRGQLTRATIVRLAVLTVVAIGIAVAFWPDGIGLLLGLAIFRLIALVMTALPLLKELKKHVDRTRAAARRLDIKIGEHPTRDFARDDVQHRHDHLHAGRRRDRAAPRLLGRAGADPQDRGPRADQAPAHLGGRRRRGQQAGRGQPRQGAPLRRAAGDRAVLLHPDRELARAGPHRAQRRTCTCCRPRPRTPTSPTRWR